MQQEGLPQGMCNMPRSLPQPLWTRLPLCSPLFTTSTTSVSRPTCRRGPTRFPCCLWWKMWPQGCLFWSMRMHRGDLWLHVLNELITTPAGSAPRDRLMRALQMPRPGKLPTLTLTPQAENMPVAVDTFAACVCFQQEKRGLGIFYLQMSPIRRDTRPWTPPHLRLRVRRT